MPGRTRLKACCKRPITELVRLTVDGREVSPQLVAIKQPGKQVLVDHYHVHVMPELTAGKHTARAVVRVVGKDLEKAASIEFSA